jgi:hypothetical protein
MDSDLVESNSTSSLRRVTSRPSNNPLQSGKFSVGQLILFSEKSVLVNRIHPLQSGKKPGGKQLTLFMQQSVLVDNKSTSSVTRVSWCPLTQTFQSG